jgi:hypothetical protein
MSTITTFEELQALDIASVHEQTHISRAKLELLFDKSFGEIKRMQFIGFVSILEREYDLDLTSLCNEYDAYHAAKREIANPVTPSSPILQAPKDPRKYWIAGAVSAIILLIIIASLTQKEVSTAPKEEAINLSTTALETKEEFPVEKPAIEANVSVAPAVSETNTSSTPEEEALTNFGKVTMIKPISKVWVGMINVATGEKIQKITKDPIVLDSSKNWLISFGHGRLEMVTAQGTTRLNEGTVVWFSYQNGVLQQLSGEVFKSKNHGSNW